ncbi:hypothetical protein [Marinobacter nauticus]|uniref:hypothetical protein n=1 Tax=Marinobacter nauticus TaxID=2743 RepID=UPI001C55BECF|nr:hypothetical protein [Marinobacter nauticus]MBW3197610.1 hypothetical protein [Marinobacter nauticus]MBY6183020.1 hypothetical protein [Marinobacter nauticus]
MASVARRTVEELVARYELEPDLNDLYVEGSFDEDFIMSAIGSEIGDRSIYTIETVDIPRPLLDKYGYTSGNKQRILTLAKELQDFFKNGVRYVCLTDLDLDEWFPPIEIIRNHRFTRYTSLEMCFFYKEYICHHLCVVCRTKIGDFDVFFDDFTAVLVKLFSLRCADKDLDLAISWVDFEKSLKRNGSGISLNQKDFLRKSLSKSNLSEKLEEVIANASRWEEKFRGDPRKFIRGHDFVRLMAWSVKNYNGVKEVSTESATSRILVSAAANNHEIAEELKFVLA